MTGCSSAMDPDKFSDSIAREAISADAKIARRSL
jgi:hypothetical protein